MNHAALLFPGEGVHHHVVDYALDWAKENEGSLKVLLLLPRESPAENYLLPNDADHASALIKNFDAAESPDEGLQKKIRNIEKRANARHIPVEFEILYSPSFDDVAVHLKDADILFIDKNIDDNPELFEELDFSTEELREKYGRIFPVGEYDRYSDVFY